MTNMHLAAMLIALKIFQGSWCQRQQNMSLYTPKANVPPPMLPLMREKEKPPGSSPGAMKAFFSTKDTVSGFGAGTIFCGCLGLVPAFARGTALGSAKVSWGCSWGWGCPDMTVVCKARLQGTPPPDCCVARTRFWLWLKVVAGALWVCVAEAVWVITVDLQRPNFWVSGAMKAESWEFKPASRGTAGKGVWCGEAEGWSSGIEVWNTRTNDGWPLRDESELKSAGWMKDPPPLMPEHWSAPTSGMTEAGTDEAISSSLRFPAGCALGKEPEGRTGDWWEKKTL